MEAVFINLCIHPIDFSDKELTMCGFLSLAFWLPCIPSVYWQFHCGCSFWQATLQSYNIGVFFVHIQTLPFYEHLEINFLLEPAYWDLRNCTICQQFLFNILICFRGDLISVLQDFGTMCNWGIRTLQLWLQMKWEEPVCQSGPIARVHMKVWV